MMATSVSSFRVDCSTLLCFAYYRSSLPGHRHLLYDDVPLPIIEINYTSQSHHHQQTLSDREALDAIAVMKDCHEKRPGQPWFVQVRT
jgi:hypothetical protein